MTRQRLALRTPTYAYLVRAITLVFACAVIWYGAMVVLLAVKVSPHTVNSLSAYRTLYLDATALSPSDFTTQVRLIAGFAGLALFLLCLYLALQELPRPRLVRGPLSLSAEDHGTVTVEPRAIERLAEISAAGHQEVTSASARLGDESLNLAIAVKHARIAAETLRVVRDGVIAQLERHELPQLPVNTTVTGYEPKNRRDLS